MLRGLIGRVMWVGRATVFLVGLTVILALVLGLASSALGASGKPFLLGKANVAKKVSTLTNSGVGAALGLNVQEGEPPLTVNSRARVDDLNADLLDGKSAADFLGGPVYSKDTAPLRPGRAVVACEAGDTMLSGGYLHPTPGESNVTVGTDRVYDDRYHLEWRHTSEDSYHGQMVASVTCSDTDGDGAGEPVLVEGTPGQSEAEWRRNAAAKQDLYAAAAAADRCFEANGGLYDFRHDCHDYMVLESDFDLDISEGVVVTVTGSGAVRWQATSKHVGSVVVYEYDSEDGVVRER